MELIDESILVLFFEGVIQLILATSLLLCRYKLKELSNSEFTPVFIAISNGLLWLSISIIVPFVLGLISPFILGDSINEYYFVLFDLPYLIISVIPVVAFWSAYRKLKNITIAT
jgi:hypothetical protein